MSVHLSAQPVVRHVHVPHPSWRALARAVLMVAVLGFVALCVTWRLDGGRWERVETPSMGTVAPVGTLLWVKPVPFDSLRAGDFITFRPPGSHGTTYSHRVVARDPAGRLTTSGVLTSPDPWHLTADDVVGKVEMRWWGAGWLVRAAPLLAAGGLLVAGAVTLSARRWKVPVSVVLGAAVLSIAIAWYQPLVNAQQLSFAPAPGGGADATYVGTGLVPIRLTAADGPSVVMRAGEVGRVHVAQADPGHRFQVSLRPEVPWWWWAVLVGCCFAPAAGLSLRSRSGSRRPHSRGDASSHRRVHRPGVPARS